MSIIQIGANLQDALQGAKFIVSGPQDPTVTATYGIPGTLFLQVDQSSVGAWQKQDQGVTTNWTPVGSGGSVTGVWTSGSGVPNPSDGSVGDFYLNTANGDVYEKTGVATWTFRGSLAGGGSGVTFMEVHEVTGPEETAQAFDLAQVPVDPALVFMSVPSAPGQTNGDDYEVTVQTLSWAGLGLDGLLVAGDKISLWYSI